MRKLTLLLAASFFLLSGPLAPAEEEASAPAPGAFTEEEEKILGKALRFERELVRLVKRVRPISVSIENWQGHPPRKVGAGSGMIVSSKGHILTNQHVVQGAVEIWVVLEDHRRLKAELVGNDVQGDVAFIKIDPRRTRSTNVRRGNPGRLSPGEWVIATGNPFHLASDGEAVVTLGIVSGLNRIVGDPAKKFFYGNAIQHDAAINPGNSGGPLWDTNGNLLGINGKIATSGAGGQQKSSSGVGFTIPIDQVRNFLDEMIEGKKALHGDQILALTVESAQDRNGKAVGAEVTKIGKGSPAAREQRGLEVGDVIYKITVRGHPETIKTATDYINRTSTLDEGTKITLHVLRGRKRLTISNLVLEPPKSARNRRRGK